MAKKTTDLLKNQLANRVEEGSLNKQPRWRFEQLEQEDQVVPFYAPEDIMKVRTGAVELN